MKKKILIVYSEMMLGGSTTSLLSFLNCLDPERYEVDLQLYRNKGELFDMIPKHVNILPQAFQYGGMLGSILKKIKVITSGYLFKARRINKEKGLSGFSGQILAEFQARHLSKKNAVHYDYAIGYIEGWTNKYLGFCVNADKKYGWIHSTFSNIASIPEVEYSWIDLVDNIVFVAEDCRKAFVKQAPKYESKAITIENLFDSAIIRTRAEKEDKTDASYAAFLKDDKFKIVTVCRLHMETKGLDRIVSCAQKLRSEGLVFSWYIIGDGEDRNKLTAMIAEAGLNDTIILLGMKTNPYPFVSKCSIMCMPSRWEGKPMTVTEAKILGVPPIVTEYLSAREQILDGVEGVVVENTEDAIVPVIYDMMNNPILIEKMRDYLMLHEYGNAENIHLIEKLLFCSSR